MNQNWLVLFTDAPVCSADRVILIGAAKNENIEIPCEIHADPPAR